MLVNGMEIRVDLYLIVGSPDAVRLLSSNKRQTMVNAQIIDCIHSAAHDGCIHQKATDMIRLQGLWTRNVLNQNHCITNIESATYIVIIDC